MSSFVNFLKPYTPFDPKLPLLHSTSFQSFVDVIQAHVLSPTPCTVFQGEELLYFFYGRPSYRVSATVTSQGQLRHLPVCFILSPESINTAKRIYPFDSGAFETGLFDAFLKGLPRDKFIVGDFPDGPQRMVSAFYENNRNYYYGNLSNAVDAGPSQLAVSGYLDMLRDTAVAYSDSGQSTSDDRRQTIEIQTNSHVHLKAESITSPNGTTTVQNKVLAVILPQRALDDPAILEAVTQIWKAKPLTYQLYKFTRPSEYHAVIREKIADLLQAERFF
jgi:hypothetical protein